MNHHRNRLLQLINTLIEVETPLPLKLAADELFTLLAEQTGLNEQAHRDNMKLPSGTAIGPFWAAMCIQDFLRTQRFMRGVLQAVSDIRKNAPDEQVHILYVGAGPFATLLLPLMARFTTKEIAVSLLDIQESALAMQKKVLEILGFQDRVKAFIHADAATCQLADSGKVHIVVAETMQHALEREPQVAISLNLASQLEPDTVWIPQNIRIEAALMNMEKDRDRQFGLLPEGESSYRILGPVLDLNLHTAKVMATHSAAGKSPFSDSDFVLPAESIEEYPWLALFTGIHIYGTHTLHARDSALCAPRLLAKCSDLTPQPRHVHFAYRAGAMPGFDFTFQ